MMEWVHCNNCFLQPGDPDKRKFLITNCGHIFCDKCNNGTLKNCPVCLRDCSSLVIEERMMEEMRVYFNEPDKTIAQQLKICEFQKSHRMKFIKHLKEKVEKYKQQLQQVKDETKRHRDDKNKLKVEVIRLNHELRKYKEYATNLGNRNSSRTTNSSSGHQSLFSLSANNKPISNANSRPEFRIFGTELQNTHPFMQKTTSSQEINFRQMNDTNSSPTMSKDNHLFTPPPPVSSQHAYRDSAFSHSKSQLIKSRDFYSPPSSETPQLNIPSHRKVPLPGDKGPTTPIGLARLTLKTPQTFGSNPPSTIRKIGGHTPSHRNNIATSKYYKHLYEQT